jgi:hypothetical protein
VRPILLLALITGVFPFLPSHANDEDLHKVRTLTNNQDPPAPLKPEDLFAFRTTDRLCPQHYGPSVGLLSMDSALRARLLQEEAPRFARAELRLFARLPDAQGPRIALLCSSNDDHDLLWLSYDAAGRLNGLDTLASDFGDGQQHRSECAYFDAYGTLMVLVADEETLRDEVDSMAYLRDTLLYEVRVVAQAQVGVENGEARHRYGLERLPRDLSARWVEKHAVNDPGPYRWRSVEELIPKDRIILQVASGNLNGDGYPDHVFVLTNGPDDGERDLLIAFTAPDASGFVLHALLPGFLPDRNSGGFHDPIGEEGISGLTISADSLVIHQFGGSAWKWEKRAVYRYSSSYHGFSLVREQSRSYHAPTISTLDDELRSFTEAAQQGRALTAEESERFAELRKAEAAYRWKVITYALGEKPMR